MRRTAKHFGNLPSTESVSTNNFKENDDTCGNQPFLIATIRLHLEMCCQEIQSDIEDAIAKYNEATSRLAEAEKNKAQADQVPPSHREAKLDGVLLGLKNDFDRPAIGENTWFFLLVGGWFPFFWFTGGWELGSFFLTPPVWNSRSWWVEISKSFLVETSTFWREDSNRADAVLAIK